jgi:hypothetical protein
MWIAALHEIKFKGTEFRCINVKESPSAVRLVPLLLQAPSAAHSARKEFIAHPCFVLADPKWN